MHTKQKQTNVFGAGTEQGVIQITLCWTVNSVEGDVEKAFKAAKLVADQVFNYGSWVWYDGHEPQYQVFVYRNPNNTYSVYIDEDEDAYGHFGF